jgi:maleate isomerase
MSASSPAADYGPRARVGIATPQANPTVEPEMRALLPEVVGVYATRLTHRSPQLAERLEHYIRHIPDAIRSFGPMRLAAFGFGCTGTSYHAGRQLEDELAVAAERECGLPVISATQAIREALTALGARRIALLSPYPEDLAEAGYRYWNDADVPVVAKLRVDPSIDDTHRIYEFTSADALGALRALWQQPATRGADCVLASGTGMPTLRALRQFRAECAVPVLSSNLCLAWALLRRAAPELAPPTPAALLGPLPPGSAAPG